VQDLIVCSKGEVRLNGLLPGLSVLENAHVETSV